MIVTQLDTELIVYDKQSHQIHRLNGVTAAVWRRCDGRATIPRVAVAVSAELGQSVDPDTVRVALGKLSEARLLDGAAGPVPVTRRRFVRGAAAGVAIPVIVSISAPSAAAAASGCSGEILDSCPNRPEAIGRCCINWDFGYVEGVCNELYECIPLA